MFKNILLAMCLCFFLKSHSQEKIVVHFFLHPTCPISQKYTLTINDLVKKYQEKPVQFEIIFLNVKSHSQLIEVKNFMHQYQLDLPYRVLKNAKYANQWGVKVTPEVLVLHHDQVQYQGAIDDWFIDWGKNKKAPEQFYLINALNSLLMHEVVWIKKTIPVGCLIELKTKL